MPTGAVESMNVQMPALMGQSSPLQIALILGGLAFLSAALMTLTAFTRIVIVLSFVRRALSTQEIPPTPVILGMSLFLTMFVMRPTFQGIEKEALTPYFNKEINGQEAWRRSSDHLRKFMIRHTRRADLALFVDLSQDRSVKRIEDVSMLVLMPAFVTSELKTAFIMGFCLFLPFLLVDIVVSVILMSLGMMMLPPVVISTPVKLLLFILVDGWRLIIKALSLSYLIQ